MKTLATPDGWHIIPAHIVNQNIHSYEGSYEFAFFVKDLEIIAADGMTVGWTEQTISIHLDSVPSRQQCDYLKSSFITNKDYCNRIMLALNTKYPLYVKPVPMSSRWKIYD